MRFKIVVRHEIDSFGEIVGVEYCVVSVNADGFERRETEWTRSKFEAQSRLAYLSNTALARAS